MHRQSAKRIQYVTVTKKQDDHSRKKVRFLINRSAGGKMSEKHKVHKANLMYIVSWCLLCMFYYAGHNDETKCHLHLACI